MIHSLFSLKQIKSHIVYQLPQNPLQNESHTIPQKISIGSAIDHRVDCADGIACTRRETPTRPQPVYYIEARRVRKLHRLGIRDGSSVRIAGSSGVPHEGWRPHKPQQRAKAMMAIMRNIDVNQIINRQELWTGPVYGLGSSRGRARRSLESGRGELANRVGNSKMKSDVTWPRRRSTSTR